MSVNTHPVTTVRVGTTTADIDTMLAPAPTDWSTVGR